MVLGFKTIPDMIVGLFDVTEMINHSQLLWRMKRARCAKGVSRQSLLISFLAHVLFLADVYGLGNRNCYMQGQIERIAKPVTLTAIACTIYLMTCKDPWRSTYEVNKELSLACFFLLLFGPCAWSFYHRVWHVSRFLHMTALFPQSYHFTKMIQKQSKISSLKSKQ